MQGLQIELILALFLHVIQIGPQHGLGHSFSIVVIVLLAFDERLGVFGGDDTGIEPQFAQCSANKMRTHARFHAHNTARQLLERRHEGQTPDLFPKSVATIVIEPNDVQCIFANVDADGKKFCDHGTAPVS
ncbi:hypothetical protein PsAD5_02432 [Pseudovibrio sp. Ad5]|nr:hypothetical protein PsAD5_02432 [Pseudovibrio sp. Ad5]